MDDNDDDDDCDTDNGDDSSVFLPASPPPPPPRQWSPSVVAVVVVIAVAAPLDSNRRSLAFAVSFCRDPPLVNDFCLQNSCKILGGRCLFCRGIRGLHVTTDVFGRKKSAHKSASR